MDEFQKRGKTPRGSQQYRAACKLCTNAEDRKKYKETGDVRGTYDHKAYVRARTRALTRLKNAVPELFDLYLKEEMEQEGLKWYPRTDGRSRRSVTKA